MCSQLLFIIKIIAIVCIVITHVDRCFNMVSSEFRLDKLKYIQGQLETSSLYFVIIVLTYLGDCGGCAVFGFGSGCVSV